MKVLVTGGNGFIGTAICRQLRTRGDYVVSYQRSEAPLLESMDVEVHQGDITDVPALLAAAQGCDAIIHTAARAGVWGPADEFERINVDGTQSVLEVCRDWGIGTLVYTSTPSVVHNGQDIQDANEFLPYSDKFLAHYPRTKAIAEQLVLEADSEALHTTAIRPHLVWGPGDPHFLPRLIERAGNGPVRLPAVEKRVDTTFVENAACAHLQALDELSGERRCAGKPYFVSDNQPMAQEDFIKALLAASGHSAEIKHLPAWVIAAAGWCCESAWKVLKRKSEPPVTRFVASQLTTHHWFDISAAKEDFNYHPMVPIREGMRLLAESAHKPG